MADTGTEPLAVRRLQGPVRADVHDSARQLEAQLHGGGMRTGHLKGERTIEPQLGPTVPDRESLHPRRPREEGADEVGLAGPGIGRQDDTALHRLVAERRGPQQRSVRRELAAQETITVEGPDEIHDTRHGLR